MNKIKVGILGATGMVGQRFVSLLADHPWFKIAALAASSHSAGKSYFNAVKDRWKIDVPMPESVKNIRMSDVTADFDKYAKEVKLIFSALNMDKLSIGNLEIKLAGKGLLVVSNNSAHRATPDVPMIIPEINSHHLRLIEIQRKKRGWKGAIIVKPNCSIQSYLPVIFALKNYQPLQVLVTTLQAVSGTGKTIEDWPEMLDNVIPHISGEEEKTEKEPLKILGSLKNDAIKLARLPQISATCIRVPVTDGHQASVAVKFRKKPSLNEIKTAINQFNKLTVTKNLPMAPKKFIHYFKDPDRPQTRLDRNLENGMAVSCGRFREDKIFDWKFVALSHNTLRGAAGGAVLTAELLLKKGYL